MWWSVYEFCFMFWLSCLAHVQNSNILCTQNMSEKHTVPSINKNEKKKSNQIKTLKHFPRALLSWPSLPQGGESNQFKSIFQFVTTTSKEMFTMFALEMIRWFFSIFPKINFTYANASETERPKYLILKKCCNIKMYRCIQ